MHGVRGEEDTREQGYFRLKPVYPLNKCCESFTRWLLGASEREGASKHDCDV